MHKRKLIEVALPLEAINREAAREKSIKHGHPSALHLWWARRPLAAARAVLFAQLVDDPSSDPEKFPSLEEQRQERARLHDLIERLVVWENIQDEALFASALKEINTSNGGGIRVLDPFAGGGSIPLEAQRFGLEAHASDINPVAVLINRAMLDVVPRCLNLPPVAPGVAASRMGDWEGFSGLAEDVASFAAMIKAEVQGRIGHSYPNVVLPDGSSGRVVAWIWARTVVCPNPACGIAAPLLKSWCLSNKKDRPAYIVPEVRENGAERGRIEFRIDSQPPAQLADLKDGSVGRAGGRCAACVAVIPLAYIREQGKSVGLGTQLAAVVAEGNRRRIYVAPSSEHELAADVARPSDVPDLALGHYPRDIKASIYGLETFADLFTARQLVILTQFSDAIRDIRKTVEAEAERFGDRDPVQYAEAVCTLLAMSLSKLADRGSSIVTWVTLRESTRNTFARQAIPMTWDFVEANPFSDGTGSWSGAVAWTVEALDGLPRNGGRGVVTSAGAEERDYRGFVVSTDPPYYDNIGYSDLSDFFYVWLRRTLGAQTPFFETLLVPKNEELVANPYRHGSRENAKKFFEAGFRRVFERMRESASEDSVATVYYAFKQSESDAEGVSSSGWETLLGSMVSAGWMVTATWPLRSEFGSRMMASGMNALASSIVLAIRPRQLHSPTTDRRGFIKALHDELPDALRNLQQGQIAPVDLPQAAIGPGMAVFSRYQKVVEADGSAMSVRSALARINEILDQVLAEQEGDFDAVSRFAIAWYRQNGYVTGSFGTADDLARARNTSVELMDRHGILTSRANKVTLIKPADLPTNYDPALDSHISNWEVLHHLIRVLESDGIGAAGAFLAASVSRTDGAVDADLVKELAFLLFSVAEKNGWTKDALSFNALAQSWPEIVAASRGDGRSPAPQGSFDFDDDGDE